MNILTVFEDFWIFDDHVDGVDQHIIHSHSHPKQQKHIIMITIHHLDHSQSFRIVWLLEELQGMVDYKIKLYKRNNDGMAPPEYKALSPLGTSPTVTTDDGLVLNESNTIIEYILDLAAEEQQKQTNTPNTNLLTLRPPPSSPDRNTYLLWFHSIQGTMQPMMTVDIIWRRAVKKTPCFITGIVKLVGSKVRDAVIIPRLQKMIEMAEQQLSKTTFLAGSNLTIADITAIYPFSSFFLRYPEMATSYPNCIAWLDRLTKRPAFIAAQERVGEKHNIVFEDE